MLRGFCKKRLLNKGDLEEANKILNSEQGFSFGVWIGNDSVSDKMTPNSTGGRIPARIARRMLEGVLSKKNKKLLAEDTETNLPPKGLGAILDM